MTAKAKIVMRRMAILWARKQQDRIQFASQG
jgi:hypothetical protein